jgi:hypothetical protein
MRGWFEKKTPFPLFPRAGGDPEETSAGVPRLWVPAFAGKEKTV